MGTYVLRVLICCSLFTNFSSTASAQIDNSVNLIKNPSFEENTGCPIYHSFVDSINDFSVLPFWKKAFLEDRGPYYINKDCYGGKNEYYINSEPRTGSSFVHLSCYLKNYDDLLDLGSQLRDLLCGQLSNPLVKGRKYYISFYTKLYYFDHGYSKYGINSLGCYLHANEFYFANFSVPGIPDSMLTRNCNQFRPQIRCAKNRFITDTANYQEIAGIYTAEGGERYITVGNFVPNAITQYREIPNSGREIAGPYAYYDFDDFTLIPYPDLGEDTCLAENDTITLRVPDYINLPGERFTWSTQQTGKSIEVHQSGIYWVEYTAGYATVRDSIHIIKKGKELAIDLLDDKKKSCSDSLELRIDDKKYQHFQWNTGDTTSSIIVKNQAYYKVQFENKAGCTFSAAAKVRFPHAWVEIRDSEYCYRARTAQALIPVNGNYDYIYWQSASYGSYINVGDSARLSPLTYWDSLYAHAWKDGCEYIAEAKFRAFPWGIAELPPDGMVCRPNEKLAIFPIANTVGAKTKILWSTGSTDSFIYINKAGHYWVKTRAANGCVYKDSVYYGYDPFTIDDKMICRGDTVTIDITNLPFGVGEEHPTTAWYYNKKRIDSLMGVNTAKFTKEGEYRMVSVLRNRDHVPPYSCLITDTFTIAYDSIKKVFSSDTTLCNTDTYRLTLLEQFDSVSWSPKNLRGNSVIISKPYGSYHATAYRNGCAATDSIRILTDTLLYHLKGRTELCPGEKSTLTLETSNKVLWENGERTLQVNLPKGNYHYYIYNPTCGVHDSVKIVEYPLDSLQNPFSETTLCTIDSVVFISHNPQAWFVLGSDSLGSQLALQQSGSYTVQYRNECAVIEENIIVKDDCLRLSIPNAFSPNGDGHNDVFKMVGYEFQSFSCAIFGRNGEKLSESSQPDNIWDGRIHGKEYAPLGVYLFVAQVVDKHGEAKVISGYVTLIL